MSVGFETVLREVTMQVVLPDAEPHRLRVVMRYDAAGPFAVRLDFDLLPHGVSWVFARDLLMRGLSAPAGDGDVRVWPSHAERCLRIALMSPDGDAVLEAATSDVADFVGRSYLACPPGSESRHLDLDAELDAFLGPS
jgi:hypothetical protein